MSVISEYLSSLNNHISEVIALDYCNLLHSEKLELNEHTGLLQLIFHYPKRMPLPNMDQLCLANRFPYWVLWLMFGSPAFPPFERKSPISCRRFSLKVLLAQNLQYQRRPWTSGHSLEPRWMSLAPVVVEFADEKRRADFVAGEVPWAVSSGTWPAEVERELLTKRL